MPSSDDLACLSINIPWHLVTATLIPGHVLRFRREFGPGGSIGEIDVETPEAIIEVFSGGKSTSKLASVQRRQNSRIMNPRGKPVILYAPGYGVRAANAIWDTGAIIVRDFESLSAALHYLRTGHLPPGHE